MVAGDMVMFDPPNDPVNRPAHYTTGKIEVLDFIEDQRFGYLDGQVIKYVSRARHKGAELEDLRKARFYLDRRIQALTDAVTDVIPSPAADGREEEPNG